MVIASEDVGLAYPQAVAVVKACVDSANMLGLPVWPFYGILALGMAICVLIFAVQIAARFAAQL